MAGSEFLLTSRTTLHEVFDSYEREPNSYWLPEYEACSVNKFPHLVTSC